MRNYKIGMVVAAVAALVFAASAFAGKSTSSLTLVVLSSANAPSAAAVTAEPSYGGQITFEVKTTATNHPSVNVRCDQDGAWVYDGWQSFWTGYVPEPVFTLSSNYWTKGAASCTARLVYYDKSGRLRTLTTTDFHVGA